MANIKPEVLKTLRLDTLQKINQGNRRTHTFQVDFSEVNENFVGSFTVHHPSQMERMYVGSIKSQLLGGNLQVDLMTDNIATIVATLDVVIDSKPEWFNPYSSEIDYDILEAVFLEYTGWLNSFRKRPTDIKPKGDSTDKPSEV